MGRSIIERVERFAMHRDGAADLQISLSQPEGDHAPGSLPVIFVTDADYFFATAAELVGLQHASRVLAPALVVGIGYGTDIFTTADLRGRDFTLPISEAAKADSPVIAALVAASGEAEAFLALLLDDLVTEVARRCPAADLDHKILFGTSLGGLFSTYALLERPEAFRSFVIGSPALYWDRYSVLQRTLAFVGKLRGLERQPRVFIGVGGTEEDVPTEAPAVSPYTLAELQETVAMTRMIGASHDLARTLRQAGLADVELMVFEGEGHQQVLPPLLNRGLRFALGPIANDRADR
jgi:predicted alpha/beta superfamily hydrolase